MSDAAAAPSAQIIAAGARTVTVTDEAGRSLVIKRMLVSDRLRFLRAVPPELQNNPLWMANALAIASVITIDGVPCPIPMNELEIERAGDRLDDAGLNAANGALTKMLAPVATPKGALAAAGE